MAGSQKSDPEIKFPSVEESFPTVPVESWFALAVIGLMVVFVAMSGGLVLTKKSRFAVVERKNQELKQQLTTKPLAEVESKSLALQRGIETYQKIVKQRTDFRLVFDDLASNLVRDARFQAVTVDENHKAKIEAEGRDFSTIARFLAGYGGVARLKDLQLLGVGKGEDSVKFSVGFTLVNQKGAKRE